MWYVLDCEPGAYLYYGFDREISKEEFMKKIGNPTFNIYSDGTICLMYDTDGMFTDHVITVKINDNGDLVKAKIEG